MPLMPGATYVDGVLCAVPNANREAYRAHASAAAALFREHGALGLVECWGDEIPEGELNSMHTAVLREPDETVVFSWIAWPSKPVRDAAWEAIRTDPRMAGMTMPFDGARMIYGGFEVLLDG